MSDYVEQVTMDIDGQSLDDVVNSLKETMDTPTKRANTMNKRRRARGFKQGNSTFDLTLNCERIAPTTGIPDWETLWRTRRRFELVCDPSVGASFTYGPCVVTNVSPSASDGDSSVDVTVMALDKRFNPI